MKIRLVKFRDIIECMRFDGGYHNADVNIYDSIIKKHSHHKLSYYCSEIFSTGRNKRTYTTPEFGYPFLSNSDVVAADPFMSCKYCSRKYDFDEKAVLKTGMILTGRVGAIGQTAFVPSYLEKAKAMGSDNIIRIVVKSEYRKGFIYAYLSSKMGQLSFWKYATGGVQPFITEVMVGQLPIPSLSEVFQEEIDELIQKSSKLKEEAKDILKQAQELVLDYCNNAYDHRHVNCTRQINLSSVKASFKTRLDPTVYINKGVEWVKNLDNEIIELGECNIKMWYPGMFKRVYVKNGYPYIKGSSIFDINPFKTCNYLSKTKTPKIEELVLTTGLLLITCAGLCGKVKIITKEYEDKHAIGSPDIIRLISNDNLITTEYLFVYMQMPAIYDYIQSLKYGSVIERIDTYNLEKLPIVKPSIQLSEYITELVHQYMECTYQAFIAEEKAIQMIEQEIESWNKK